ncbi:hypothetical protein [Actinoplanes sp. NPDC051859]|uniref:hypothetical protein n=1 Tax=Actinoplanes sp. NPDC051859 TaxID=3363909 RepID=UPI0037A82485
MEQMADWWENTLALTTEGPVKKDGQRWALLQAQWITAQANRSGSGGGYPRGAGNYGVGRMDAAEPGTGTVSFSIKPSEQVLAAETEFRKLKDDFLAALQDQNIFNPLVIKQIAGFVGNWKTALDTASGSLNGLNWTDDQWVGTAAEQTLELKVNIAAGMNKVSAELGGGLTAKPVAESLTDVATAMETFRTNVRSSFDNWLQQPNSSVATAIQNAAAAGVIASQADVTTVALEAKKLYNYELVKLDNSIDQASQQLDSVFQAATANLPSMPGTYLDPLEVNVPDLPATDGADLPGGVDGALPGGEDSLLTAGSGGAETGLGGGMEAFDAGGGTGGLDLGGDAGAGGGLDAGGGTAAMDLGGGTGGLDVGGGTLGASAAFDAGGGTNGLGLDDYAAQYRAFGAVDPAPLPFTTGGGLPAGTDFGGDAGSGPYSPYVPTAYTGSAASGLGGSGGTTSSRFTTGGGLPGLGGGGGGLAGGGGGLPGSGGGGAGGIARGAESMRSIIGNTAAGTGNGSGMPMYPPMAGGMGAGSGQGGNKERERTTWLAEDSEVWGTEPGAVPGSVGRPAGAGASAAEYETFDDSSDQQQGGRGHRGGRARA